MSDSETAEGDFTPIRDYGVIGDCRSLSLVSKRGSIDWCCFPKFDARSVFAAILDPVKGGRFSIRPSEKFEPFQTYIGDTNVLRERFTTDKGTCIVTELMPCYMVDDELQAFHEIHRLVECTGGEVELSMDFSPRMNFGQGDTSFEARPHGCLAWHDRESLSLSSDTPLVVSSTGATATPRLRQGEKALFVLRYNDDIVREPGLYRTEDKLRRTLQYWERWSSRITYKGRWRPAVTRSALALRLLVYSPSGTIIAAPTTSIPEVVGGHKNWDYRFSWLRDSAMTVWALCLVGHNKERWRYMRWIRRRLRGQVRHLENLKVLHGVEGDMTVAEKTLDHLSGYRGSRPVRIGNAAHDQFQLDTYGSLVDAIYFTHDEKREMTDDLWRMVQSISEFVSENWTKPDYSIWEVRGRTMHYTYSKVMCWVAMDRAVKIANIKADEARAMKWSEVRDSIREDIIENGVDKDLGCFIQAYGSQQLDGSLLAMPFVGFISAKDPTMARTIDLIRERLETDGLVFRFRDGTTQADDGAFIMCSFWLVECLALQGNIDQAVELFERILRTANHLGLLSEQVVPTTHEFLGNFPQGLSHISLIIAADTLTNALNSEDSGDNIESLNEDAGREA